MQEEHPEILTDENNELYIIKSYPDLSSVNGSALVFFPLHSLFIGLFGLDAMIACLLCCTTMP